MWRHTVQSTVDDADLREQPPALRMAPKVTSTPYADVATYTQKAKDKDAGKDLPTLVFIHGNSSSSKFMAPFFHMAGKSEGLAGYTLVAIDLPGHGNSENAKDKVEGPKDGPQKLEEVYTIPGYAATVGAVLKELGVTKAIVTGHSMGGHVAVNLLPVLQKQGIEYKGLCITGTPPLAKGEEGMAAGFPAARAVQGKDEEVLMEKEKLSDEEIQQLVGALTQGKKEWEKPFFAQDMKRAEGPQRSCMWKAGKNGYKDLSFETIDEKETVENSDVPIAVINGKEDPFIFVDYIPTLKIKSLHGGKCEEIDGAYHCSFWEYPQKFIPMWEKFVKGVS